MATRVKNPRLQVKTDYTTPPRHRIPTPRPGRDVPLRPRGVRRIQYGLSLAELLMQDPEAQGTTLERLVDGVAKELGVVWDGRQLDIPLTMSGRFTRVDRVKIMGGKVCLIYIDGPQHTLRLNQMQADAIQDMELESMGFVVIRLPYDELITDPIGTFRRRVITRLWL